MMKHPLQLNIKLFYYFVVVSAHSTYILFFGEYISKIYFQLEHVLEFSW